MRREARVIDAARQIREIDPGIGGYKLWLMMKQMFCNDRVPCRDIFYRLLAANGMQLPRPKPRHTTNSNHHYHKYLNLIRGFIPTGPNQLWVADITYVELEEGCCYLHLITDAYSHKILGWCLSDTLEAKYTIMALLMAVEKCGQSDLTGLIHHSDRGSQYCSTEYTSILKKLGVRISMTEDYKPTDNAIAERVNGIIKTEVLYRIKRPANHKEASERISEFITFYNARRPHMSIGYQTPEEAHEQTGEQERKWRKYYDDSCKCQENVVSLHPEMPPNR